MGKLAILAGAGTLPVQISTVANDAIRIGFFGVQTDLEDTTIFRFEKLGALFSYLKDNSVSEVVFAGSMARPPLDSVLFDTTMQDLAPRLMAAMQGGDDSLLRLVIDIFDEQGFLVRGAHEVVPDLTAKAGHLAGPFPGDAALKDAKRGAAIIHALSSMDVGQGAVVADGLCLGIETLQGTDAMLGFVAHTPNILRRNATGVLVKTAKLGQDLRVDMPAIGPKTIQAAVLAGVAGIVIGADKVMILERAKTLDAVEKSGLFLSAHNI